MLIGFFVFCIKFRIICFSKPQNTDGCIQGNQVLRTPFGTATHAKRTSLASYHYEHNDDLHHHVNKFSFGSFRKNLMGVCLFVRRDWEHLEEESEVLNVVRAVIVMDSEPEHCVGIGILVSNNTGCSSRGDQNRRSKRSGSLRGDQTKVIVPIDILLFELV